MFRFKNINKLDDYEIVLDLKENNSIINKMNIKIFSNNNNSNDNNKTLQKTIVKKLFNN